jgi:pimeloyl-ACP methyl ester carboxylesterase
MVFLHDGLVHRLGFDGPFRYFSRDFTVVCYDRPGYGDSKPPSVPYSHVETLRGLLESLGLETAILIGGSAGGGIAIDFTLAYPSKVGAMVLVGAPVSGFEFTDHMWYRGWKNRWGDTTEEIIRFWVDDPWLVDRKNPAAQERVRALLTDCPHNLEHSPGLILEDGEAVDRLSEIAIPTLVMVGESDIADNHAHAGVIELGIKGAKRIVVTDAGHLVYLERPEEFNRLVMEFLAENGLSRPE